MGDTCWPSPSDWSHLNGTLSGTLIRAVPPASVCYPSKSNYDPSACSLVRSQWFNSSWHLEDPVSIDYPVWTDNSCNPLYPNGTSLTGDPNAGERGCNADTYPTYVVNVTNAAQIATALEWAGEKDIRVVVKATGHSYTGRSTAPNSLSIWTHNLHGMSFLSSFSPTSCPLDGYEPMEAIRVAAGHTNGEIQKYLSEYDKVIVSGANPSVGIVGWLTAGGHGYLSSTYGMGSDNLLEATVVLPSGRIVVANPCQNEKLFWAIRGGGGGTYGVVTEVVLKTYPSPKTTMHVFTLSSHQSTTENEFYDTMSWLHAHMQVLKQGGMQGYYYIVGPPTAPTLSFLWSFTLFDKPAGTVKTLMVPVDEHLAQRSNLFTTTSNITEAATYWDLAQHFQNEPVANGGSTYGSRLLSVSSLSNPTLNAKALKSVGPSGDPSNPNVRTARTHLLPIPASFQRPRANTIQSPFSNPLLIGHMIASPNQPSYSPSTSSLNPAWRTTLVHLVVTESWPDALPGTTIEAIHTDVTAKTAVLRAWSPHTGAYFNEADAKEPEWQDSFFGANYQALRRVKREIDPQGVLWCAKCVGSEAFREEGGRLCKVGGDHKTDGEGEREKSEDGEESELRP